MDERVRSEVERQAVRIEALASAAIGTQDLLVLLGGEMNGELQILLAEIKEKAEGIVNLLHEEAVR